LAGSVYRIQTDKGELVITTESDDVEVVVKQGGELVRIIDTKTEKSITLRSGVYELELKDAPGLKLDLEKATLKRGKETVATIERVTAAGLKVGEVRQFVGHAQGIYPVAYSPDGRHILTGATIEGNSLGHCDLQLWDAGTGKELRRFKGQQAQICATAFSADGKLVVAGGTYPDPIVRVWDVASTQLVRQFTHDGGAYGVAFTAEARHVLSCGMDGTARMWSMETGKEVRRFAGLNSVVRCLALSKDQRLLACGGTAGDASIFVWEVDTGKVIKQFKGHTWEGESGETCVAFSPDGKHVVSGGYDGTVRIWDLATGRESQRFTGHAGLIGGVAYSPDGSRILSGGDADRTVRLWDVKTGKVQHRFTSHTLAVRGVAFSPDGRFAVSGSVDNTARLWRLPDPPAAKDKP
jgi:hypothetical protein